MIDESKIISQCLSGNQQAFASLVDKYKSLVCSLAYCATGSFDISEDIAQEVFIIVWKNLSGLKEHDKFTSWLTTITRNAVKHYLRDENSRPKTHRLDIEDCDLATETPDDPSGTTIKREENAMLWDTLDAMPLEYRETLVLYYRHEKSTKQVAALLAVSPETVRQRLSRGREMLKDRIERKLETGLKNTAPGKKFTASVVAAISALPIGVAVSEAAVSGTAASTASSILSLTAAKIAAILITAAAITAAVVIGYNKKPSTAQPLPAAAMTQPGHAHATLAAHSSAPDINTPTSNPPEEKTTAPKTAESQTSAPAATDTAQPQSEGFTPRGVLSGLITDIKTGEPVIDAEIKIELPNGKTETTYVDENGFYYFDTLSDHGNCELGITSEEYVGLNFAYENRLLLNILPDSKNIQHIQLEKACMLEVEVVDEDNNPIEQAVAVVSDPDSRYAPALNEGYKLTDKKGKVILGGIRPSKSSYMVTIKHNKSEKTKAGQWITYANYAPTHQEMVMNDPEVIESIKVVMKKGIDIEGRLLYADGLPANDLKISAKPQWWHCNYGMPGFQIKDDGTFTIKHIDPGLHDINVSIPTGKDRSLVEKIETRSLNESDYLDLTLEFNSPSETDKFSGKIIIDGNCDIKNIHISGYNQTDNFSKELDIENNAREIMFEIDRVKPGSYTVSFNCDNLKRDSIEDVLIPADNFEHTLKCRNIINISGMVTDKKTGLPVNEFRIMPNCIKSYEKTSCVADTTWANYAQSNNGQFVYEIKEEGIYEFTIDNDAFAPQIITLDTATNRSLILELTAGATLTGKVVNSEGKAIKGARLVPFMKNAVLKNTKAVLISEKASATTDENGEFTLEKLPAGEETIKIIHPDYPAKTITIKLPNDTSSTTITLNSSCSIEGYVYDNSGNPRANFNLTIQDKPFSSFISPTSQLTKTTTDQNGYYKFDNLPGQFCFVMHPVAFNTEGSTLCGVLLSDSQNTRLDLGGQTFLKGRILLNGSPLADTPVAIADRAVFYYSGFLNNSKTDDNGSFCFSGIPEGVRKLFYKKGDQNEWTQIAEFDTKNMSFDLGDIIVDGTDIEISISGDEVKMSACTLTEDYAYPVLNEKSVKLVGDNRFEGQSIMPGKYVLRAYRKNDNAIFLSEIDVPFSEKPFAYELQLPKATASVRGKLTNDPQTLACRKDDLAFIGNVRSGNDGTYFINNMPAGKYYIMNVLNNTPVSGFELKDGQELAHDLDNAAFGAQPAVAILIPVDSQSKLSVNSYYAWLEAKGFKYDTAIHGLLTATPGEYTLHITCPGYKDYSHNITLTPCDMAKPQDIPTITVILERK